MIKPKKLSEVEVSEEQKAKNLKEMIESGKPPGFLGGHFKPGYNIGLGEFVESRSHLKRIMKKQGVIEAGDRVKGSRSIIGNATPPGGDLDHPNTIPDLRTEADFRHEEKEKKYKERAMNDLADKNVI